MAEQTPVAQRRSNLLSRFSHLFKDPKPPEQAEEPPAPTRDQLLASELGPWLKQAPKAFWRELARWEDAAHTQVRSSISDHALTSYALGFEDALAQIRTKLTEYRGQSAKSDPQGE